MYGKKEYLSYPFLYEEKNIVDFELATDELASYLGLCISIVSDTEFKDELIRIAQFVYHINPMVRKKLSINEQEILWLQSRYECYLERTKNRDSLFVLPTGTQLASTLHICRCKSKKIVRLTHQIVSSGIEVDESIFDYINVLANYLFTAAMYANLLEKHNEIAFVSRVYNSKKI